MTTTPRRLVSLVMLASIALAACTGGGASTAPSEAATTTPTTAPSTNPASSAPQASSSAAAVTYRCSKGDGQLNGSGSTFINPLLTKMAGDYDTCLLYTSPSPRDGLLSRMPSSA